MLVVICIVKVFVFKSIWACCEKLQSNVKLSKNFCKRVEGEQEEARNKELRGFGHKNGRLGQGFTLLRR